MPQLTVNEIKQRYRIVGNHEALNQVLEMAQRIASSDISVLVVGENGTGKETIPRIIHDQSPRARKPYMAVNCGAIPDGTIDSELFGHVKGAYTGAVDSREGYFGAANGGTLFLDEVGELPLATQARLLRVLETGEYIPVGSNEVKRTNVRIVAATNVDMARAIARGRFRQDLYYRLNGVTLLMPPLRERGADIELLFRKFAMDMQQKYHMPPVTLTPEAVRLLSTYRWPGNIRQLLHVVESMSVTCDERQISAETLRQFLPDEPHGRSMAVAGEREDGQYSYDQEREILFQMIISLRKDVNELRALLEAAGISAPHSSMLPAVGSASAYAHSVIPLPSGHVIDGAPADLVSDRPYTITEVGLDEPATIGEVEREAIRRALERNGGRRAAAAKEIGISERTLYRKIKEYGLSESE